MNYCIGRKIACDVCGRCEVVSIWGGCGWDRELWLEALPLVFVFAYIYCMIK
jgi:hypothetical protein